MRSAPISVLIPTLRRPDSLTRTLRSVFAQDGAETLIQDIIVVDNSPEGSARRFVDRLRTETPIPLLYVHEPHPGVATARNTGLAAAHGAYIAFIDDDEEAPSHWLAHLFHTHKTCKADVTFGPVQGVTPNEDDWAKAYLDRFFSREGPAKSGVIDNFYGCGNSLMTRATVLGAGTPFNPEFDQVGGEDDWLFEHLKADGGVFAWAAEALVYEHVPHHRAHLTYTLRRAFSYGQTPARICADRSPRDWRGLAYWMSVGAAQAAVHGAWGAILELLGSPRRADAWDKAARGLGKVIWWRTPTFYGQAEIARQMETAPQPAI